MKSWPGRYTLYCFNPRPREEGDRKVAAGRLLWLEFQSTPSRRGRRILTFYTIPETDVSIHALAKRATGMVMAVLA